MFIKIFQHHSKAGLCPLWRTWKKPVDAICGLYKMKQSHWLLCIAKTRLRAVSLFFSSLFFPSCSFSSVVPCTRGSVERQSHKMREMRAAAQAPVHSHTFCSMLGGLRKKRGCSFSCLSCLAPSVTRVCILARFVRRTKKKERLLVV